LSWVLHLPESRQKTFGSVTSGLVSWVERYFDSIYGTCNALLASVDGLVWWADIFALLGLGGCISMEAFV